MGNGGSKAADDKKAKRQSMKVSHSQQKEELKEQIKDMMLKENTPHVSTTSSPQLKPRNTADQDEKRWKRARETGNMILGHRELTEVPAELFKLSMLTNLDLASNNLEKLPEKLNQFTELKSLDISSNDLAILPALVLPNLESFSVSHNQLDNLPSLVTNLLNLQRLNLSYNVLSSIPSLTALSKLQVLRVNDNQLETSPDVRPEMRELYINNNQISKLTNLRTPPALVTLNASVNHIPAVPAGLMNAYNLVTLDLTSNSISTLPAEIGNLTALKDMLLGDNNIQEIPSEIGQLRSLTRLDLSHNRIQTLPDSLSQLGSLLILNLSSNDIKSTDCIQGSLSNLRELLLGDNLLTEAPAQLSTLTSLRVLFLGFNKLTTFPLSHITPLSSLGSLCLSGNKTLTTTSAAGVTEWECPIREYYLAGCGFKKAPEILDFVRYIRILDVKNSLFSSFPSTLLPKIANSYWLDSSHTPIESSFWDKIEKLKKKEREALDTPMPKITPEVDLHNFRPFIRRESKNPSSLFTYGVADVIGKREFMEDEVLIYQGQDFRKRDVSLFAVLDGHGGRQTVNFVRKNYASLLFEQLMKVPPELAIRSSFLDMNRQLEQHRQTLGEDLNRESSGATMVVCLIVDNMIYTANVGDARSVLSRGAEVHRLSKDHKPLLWEEEQRIRNLGGFVTSDGRVMGRLAVSRALGDLEMSPYISADPFIFPWTMSVKDDWLILACDGVWDVLSDRAAIQLLDGVTDPVLAATKIRDHALFSGSSDNISVIVVDLHSKDMAKTRRGSVAVEKKH